MRIAFFFLPASEFFGDQRITLSFATDAVFSAAQASVASPETGIRVPRKVGKQVSSSWLQSRGAKPNPTQLLRDGCRGVYSVVQFKYSNWLIVLLFRIAVCVTKKT